MLFIWIFLLLAVSLGVASGLLLIVWLAVVLQRRGVWRWLLAPFRAWAGLEETRKPRP